MQKHINYSVGSNDGKSISFKKEDTIFIGQTFTLKFWHISIIVAIIIFIILVCKYLDISRGIMTSFTTTTNESITIVPEDNTSYSKQVFTDGFVFKDSNTRILTREEVLAFQNTEGPTFPRILRMAINEIYARKGQVFRTGGINDNYYQQYEWYVETSKHTVEWNEFNEQEKANLRLLISIEEEYNYR